MPVDFLKSQVGPHFALGFAAVGKYGLNDDFKVKEAEYVRIY